MAVLGACRGARDADRPISPEAAAYLEDVLDILERRSLRRHAIDWPEYRRRLFALADGAVAPADTHRAIRFMVGQLGDGHSGFATPAPEAGALPSRMHRPPLPTGELLAGPIGYVWLPHLVGQGLHAQDYADTLQTWIRRLDRHAPCGWIVDLTDNGGGNMWPMLAGIGPLLGEGDVGRFVDADGAETAWSYRDGRAMEGAVERARVRRAHALARPGAPVAVLTGPRTASSGEAIAVAFRGRANTRSFGRSTAGLSTGNADYTLTDGAVLTLTEVILADRDGTTYGRALEPDEPTRWLGPSARERALAWLHAHGACASAPR